MAIPLRYNLRNLFARKVSTILTAVGIGLVSWVFIFTLALAGGFQAALQETGSHQNAIVVRNGSTAELTSILPREAAAAIESQPEIARATDGTPLATHELVVLWNLERKNGTSTNVVVRGVLRKAPAGRVLRPGDRILAVNGKQVHSLGRLHTLIASHRPGDTLSVTYSRSGRTATAKIRTIASTDDKRQAAIGILVDETGGSVGKLPIKVRINTQGVGGPSAGLAFALDLMEELGHNVDNGYKVAATGELALDGSVLPIGAVKQKTIGAREASVDVFLVPAGSNARVARKYAQGLKIVPVQSFPQALHALATLPTKHPGSA